MQPDKDSSASDGPAVARLPRGTLDRDVIVDRAMAAVGELGVEALTVPAVAKELGVRPTAVYWHFRRKEDLLAALREEATRRFNELFPTLPHGSWDELVRQYWTEYRRILRADPVLCELVVVQWASAARSRAARQHHFQRIEPQLEMLRAAGFTAEQASRAYHSLSTYTRGCLLNERAARLAAVPDGPQASTSTLGAELERLPALHEAEPYWTISFATDEDFTAGLTTFIRGLHAELADARR